MITTYLYFNDQISFSRLYPGIFNTTFKHIFASSNKDYINTLTTSYNTSSPYIWCVNHYGPNNQIRDFVKCCIIAMLNNYTIIVPPLYPHYGDKSRGMQWFDHFYDLKQLSLAFNFITLDDFIQKNKINEKNLMIDCYIQQIESVSSKTWYSKNTLISTKNYYKININFHRYINLSNTFNINELTNKAKNCSSIFLHIHYTKFAQFFSSSNIHIQKVFQYLRRTALIQRMTSQLIKLLPQLVINKNHSNNNFTTLGVVHMRLGDYIVMNVSMYIKQVLYLINNGVHFTHLHIMCPYLKSTDIRQLMDNLPVPFTITQHILDHVRFILDDYLFDVLEQEIAYQAPIFIASPSTIYSATIFMQKVYQQKGIVYVFSNKGDYRPFLATKNNTKYFK